MTDPEKKPKILLVDDDPVNLMLLTRILSFEGFECLTVGDPEEALVMLLANPKSFNLVLTDLNMPQMTGKDLIRRMRENGCSIPVVIATSSPVPVSEEMIVESTKTGQVYKVPAMQRPLDPTNLSSLIRKNLASGNKIA